MLKDVEEKQLVAEMKQYRRFVDRLDKYAFICTGEYSNIPGCDCCEEDGYPTFFSGFEELKARAHENFTGHIVVVVHEKEGLLGPLRYFCVPPQPILA